MSTRRSHQRVWLAESLAPCAHPCLRGPEIFEGRLDARKHDWRWSMDTGYLDDLAAPTDKVVSIVLNVNCTSVHPGLRVGAEIVGTWSAVTRLVVQDSVTCRSAVGPGHGEPSKRPRRTVK